MIFEQLELLHQKYLQISILLIIVPIGIYNLYFISNYFSDFIQQFLILVTFFLQNIITEFESFNFLALSQGFFIFFYKIIYKLYFSIRFGLF